MSTEWFQLRYADPKAAASPQAVAASKSISMKTHLIIQTQTSPEAEMRILDHGGPPEITTHPLVKFPSEPHSQWVQDVSSKMLVIFFLTEKKGLGDFRADVAKTGITKIFY